LRDVASRIVLELQSETPARAVRWEIGDLPDIDGDPTLQHQVLFNLMSNALKYSRNREDARIEVGSKGNDANVATVYVKDNGAGFEMQYASKLFSVFQRLHRAEEFEGTGIGLAIVRRIIERHGGRVWAEGRPGEGATFYFSQTKWRQTSGEAR